MTAVNGHTTTALPDPVTVLKRIDKRLAARSGDDPLPSETIEALADGVQRQLIEPLLASQMPAAGEDLVDELRAQRDQLATDKKVLTAERDMLRTQLADAKADTARRVAEAQREAGDTIAKLRKRLAAQGHQLDEVRAERDTATGRARDLETEVEYLDEFAQAARHEHRYPWLGGDEFGPCDCGQPYPRAVLRVEGPDEPPELEPLEELLSRVRGELGALGFPDSAGRVDAGLSRLGGAR